MNPENGPERSESQMTFARLLDRDSDIAPEKNDALRRFAANAVIFSAATAVDMAESHVADAVMRKPLHAMVERTEERVERYQFGQQVDVHEPSQIEEYRKTLASLQNRVVNAEGLESAADFVEEWASDSAYATLANAWLRHATGNPTAHYTSGAAVFISDWSNKILQVFAGNPVLGAVEHRYGKAVPKRGAMGIKLGYQSADLVNAVNVEAFMRMMEEVPVVRGGVKFVRHGIERAMENKPVATLHTAANVGILGFHIGRTMAKARRHA